MATYAALLYYTRDYDWAAPEQADVMKEYDAFHEAAAQVIRGGAALQPTTTATTVAVTGGKGGDVVLSDGPFAEVKEVLGGFYLLEAADLDEAVRWAQQIPAAWECKVELRPLSPMPDGA
jgi:hypothetical protein